MRLHSLSTFIYYLSLFQSSMLNFCPFLPLPPLIVQLGIIYIILFGNIVNKSLSHLFLHEFSNTEGMSPNWFRVLV